MTILKINNISKSYGSINVIDNISLNLEHGIYGLVGANGAGKTTLIKIISGLISSDKGSVLFKNKIINKNLLYRSSIGFMPQSTAGYDNFTGRQLLWYIASLKKIDRNLAKEQIDKLIEVTNLSKDIDKKIKEFSGGMRQRLMLIQALIGNPEVVFLDEPTAGLDPSERIKVRNYISQFSDNKIVIIATHVMQDIEAITDRVILLSKGKVKYEGSVESIIKSVEPFVYEKKLDEHLLIQYQQKYKVSTIIKKDGQILIRYISETKMGDNHIQPTLEDVYLHYLVD